MTIRKSKQIQAEEWRIIDRSGVVHAINAQDYLYIKDYCFSLTEKVAAQLACRPGYALSYLTPDVAVTCFTCLAVSE